MGREKWSSLVWLGIAIFICVGSLKLSLGNLKNPGPGMLSFLAGSLLGILAILVHFQARRVKPAKTKPIWKDAARGWKMILTVVALLVYALAMEYIGFLLSTLVFLAFLLRVIEPQRWPVVIFGSAGASGAAYLIFEVWLQSQLPKSPFEIF